MKKGAILLNTSRGPIVDELALIAALESGHLASAGLDVYELEPLSATSPLRDLEHIVLTPHMASYSEQSWQALRDEVCDTVGAWIKHAWASSVVNPEVRDHLRLRISN
jgi:phosphoglycerate dehydrogenase-like enzyme